MTKAGDALLKGVAFLETPNADRAVVDREKLRDYCLSRDHPCGRHKARVIASSLGLTAQDTEQLREALLAVARLNEAVSTVADEYGQRYVVDFAMATTFRQANIRSIWIVRAGDDFPRLVTCFVR
jgi:hypothetical protein